MDSTDFARERATTWMRRSVELSARIRALHERNAQLSAGFGPPDFEGRRAAGSTPDQVAKARAAAKMAATRALEALQRTAIMRMNAARAHDRVAQLHEMLAGEPGADVQEHLGGAALHRRLARADRAAADVILRSQPGQPGEPGPS